MDGSGLQDVLSTIYARASTEKMVTGHAYSRAHIDSPNIGSHCVVKDEYL